MEGTYANLYATTVRRDDDVLLSAVLYDDCLSRGGGVLGLVGMTILSGKSSRAYGRLVIACTAGFVVGDGCADGARGMRSPVL